jgi:Protein of unknown function (DUF3105)
LNKKSLSNKERRKRKKLYNRIIWGIAGVAVLGVIGYALWIAFRPAYGQSVPVMADISHVPADTDPGPYNSDPPTSGKHYENNLRAGFYNESDLANLPDHPEGMLVHSLEHGYVIFWYNCAPLSEQECTDLKGEIQQAMDRVDNVKVIAFPWDSIDEPVVMTSWGQLQRFNSFDVDLAVGFVERNRYQAPEPNAP